MRNGGGIGDVLAQPTLDDPTYAGRGFFDIFFYILIIIIMLNLIFGIILDAFAGLRDEKEAIDRDVKGQCFICGIDKFKFETKYILFFYILGVMAGLLM